MCMCTVWDEYFYFFFIYTGIIFGQYEFNLHVMTKFRCVGAESKRHASGERARQWSVWSGPTRRVEEQTPGGH